MAASSLSPRESSHSLRRHVQTFRTAAWLGWQIESNWTDPLSFFIFSILKPISGALILVFMYNAVAQVAPGDPIFAYIYLGNAFYIYVGAVLTGTSFAILDDRERYRSLKYIYVAPLSVPIYMVGRAVARFVIGSLAVLITLGAGLLFFNLPIAFGAINWPLFIVALLIGLLSLIFFGLVMGMWTLTLRAEPWLLGDGVAAALYLFSGAIFPLDVLPRWLQWLGYLMPISYWLELLRRALLGREIAAAFPTFAAFSDGQLLGLLSLITLGFGLLSIFGFRWFDHIARERGMIDTTNNF